MVFSNSSAGSSDSAVDEAQRVVADRHHVAVLQRVLLDDLAVDVRAVRAVEILEERVVEDVDDERVVAASPPGCRCGCRCPGRRPIV